MKIATTPGEAYALTAPSPCTVSAVQDSGGLIPLLIITTPGQYVLVAPASFLDISAESALVTPVRGRISLANNMASAVECSYETLSLALQGGNENLNAHGFGIAAEASGTLLSVSVRARDSNLLHRSPLWLKVWILQGNSFVYRGVSANSVTQQLSLYGTWNLPGIPLKTGDHVLFTFHAEPSRDSSAWGNCAIGDMRVQAIPHADHAGCIRSPSNPPVMYDYLPDYRLDLRTVTGVRAGGNRLAFAETLAAHAGNGEIHITPEERNSWNAKADASSLAGKLNSATFTAHKSDAGAHLSPSERLSLNELLLNKDALMSLIPPAPPPTE